MTRINSQIKSQVKLATFFPIVPVRSGFIKPRTIKLHALV